MMPAVCVHRSTETLVSTNTGLNGPNLVEHVFYLPAPYSAWFFIILLHLVNISCDTFESTPYYWKANTFLLYIVIEGVKPKVVVADSLLQAVQQQWMLRWHGNAAQLTSWRASQWHQTSGPFPSRFGLAPVTIDVNLTCQKILLVVGFFSCRPISNPHISLLVNMVLCHCFTRSQAPKPTSQCCRHWVSIHFGSLSEFPGSFFPLLPVSLCPSKAYRSFMGNVLVLEVVANASRTVSGSVSVMGLLYLFSKDACL